MKKLYDTIQQLTKKTLNSKSQVEVLIIAFIDKVCDIKLILDNNERVKHFFFTHPAKLELMRLNHDVLVVDSIYKTNEYIKPLLHIVASTEMRTTFCAAFFFMKNENESSHRTAVGFVKTY